MSLIDVPNLREIEPWEGVAQKFFKSGEKKKKKEKKNVGNFGSVFLAHY